MRRYFGTDGVRGVVGEALTTELVERLGGAVTRWSGGGRVFVGRDTRGSGPELEEAFARGVVAAGGNAVLAGVLPTPAVALLALDVGVVISASHNPPEYNGVKLFTGQGRKLTDAQEEEIEALLDAPPRRSAGSIDRVDIALDSYLDHVVERFGTDLAGLRIGVDCANGAYSAIGAEAFAASAPTWSPSATRPTAPTSTWSAARPTCACSRAPSPSTASTSASPSTATATACSPSTPPDAARRRPAAGRARAALGVDLVAVTVMTNLGFHRLMADHGIRVVTTDVGDRYVLDALDREGGQLGGEQSGHLIYLRDHVTGDGLAAALLVCGALGGRTLAEAAAVMPRYPQVKENIRVARRELTPAIREEVEALNAKLVGDGRILVRPSGTEPVVRVLAEARTREPRATSVVQSALSFDESSVEIPPTLGVRGTGLLRFWEASTVGFADRRILNVRDHRVRRKP